MTRSLRILLAFLVLALPASVLAACGGVPGNAVATVDGDAIEKTSFDHWMNVASKSGGQPGAQVPKPPDYKACVANLKKTQPAPAKGQPKVTDAQLKTQCKQQYEGLRDQVVQLLASFEWIEGEAKEMNLKVADKDVTKRIDEIKKQQFPKKGDYEKFLKDSGYTQEDVEIQTRTELLTNKIRDKVTKGKDKVSTAEVNAYYAKNKARFAQPERRDLRVVLTKTKAKAEQAKAARSGGQSFAAVAKKFSEDQASKAQGGKLPGVAKNQQEKAFDTAIFSAKKGQLEGPVKTQFGYYVFEVATITAASQQTLQQAAPTIKQLLVSQKQQKSIETFAKTFQKKWKAKTECGKGFVTQSCKGAPEPTPTPAAAGGAAPTQPAAPTPTP